MRNDWWKPNAIILKRGIQVMVLGFVLGCSLHYSKSKQVDEKFNFNFNNMSKVVGLNGEVKENEELVKFAPIEGTPFTVARIIEDSKDEPDYYVLFGSYRFSDALSSEQEAIDSARVISWDKIIAVMSIAIKDQEKWLNSVDFKGNE